MSLVHHAMTIDGEGIVLVMGNSRETRIDVRSRNGAVLRRFRLTGAGLLRSPGGVAADGAGSVYVADSGNDRVVVFDAAGGFVRAFSGRGSGAGELRSPIGVAVDGAGST
jgi:DNA-binding beta-propeller fold protein YncE